MTGATVLLGGCSNQTKYEPLEVPTVAETVREKETGTGEEEVLSLVTLPPQVFVKVPVNLLIEPGNTVLGAFEDRGTRLDVTGYQGEDAEGNILYFEVSDGENTGYINSWYVCEDADDALRPEIATPNEEGVISEENMPATGSDAYYLSINSLRENRYGGGSGGDPDFYARDKEFKANKIMPDRVKALYLTGRAGGDNLDEFIEIARDSGINAFVVNIADNTEIAYQSEVMKAFCPSAYEKAIYEKEEYAERIAKLKDAGFYVIGRMTTFNDDYLADDHPELTICDLEGNPKELSNGYWPTPYSRKVWQYKLDIAEEAVDWFDFDEIQFDYVRFPDRTQSAEKEGNIDYRNDNNESKVQAIQRFLMYVTDHLHEKGVNVGADVFGEVSESFVGGYGQYWPAISNVVDVICGMPYPDHYAGTEDYLPWEHPYETIKHFAETASERQKECPTPARVRTWIQGYNSFREPHTQYYAENVGQEIKALYDAGLTDGWMIWNGSSSLESCRKQSDAFSMEP
ncbi:MAG: putative glycoside hydrolase [Lachnospiraceae bacterium]|nr:putative glycoside hydrolase [Lachnospiraceae bacterium]